MRIAVASGKGGTGKTTVATNLALSAGQEVLLLDCDVEEPNCHVFLNGPLEPFGTVSLPVPEVDEERCTACGECARICAFGAMVSLKSMAMAFTDLCHGCGGCSLVCSEGAIREVAREIGKMERVSTGPLTLIHGRLRVGEAMSPPLIKAVRNQAGDGGLTIIDAPPGTSCPVIEAVRGCDYVVLVTEPTPFGLNDLRLAVGMVRRLGLPSGVVVNRSDLGDDQLLEYCREQGIKVLLEIPNDRRLAAAYARGRPAFQALPEEYGERFRSLLQAVRQEVA